MFYGSFCKDKKGAYKTVNLFGKKLSFLKCLLRKSGNLDKNLFLDSNFQLNNFVNLKIAIIFTASKMR
jgi:hypothetical protein